MANPFKQADSSMVSSPNLKQGSAANLKPAQPEKPVVEKEESKQVKKSAIN